MTKLLALLGGIISIHDDTFYYLNCFHSFRTKIKLESLKMYVKIKIFVKLTETQ